MAHATSLFAVLYGVWLALSGHYTLYFLLVGAVCVALVVAIAMRMDVVDREGHPMHLTWRVPGYWAWLMWEIMTSAVDVSRRVLAPRLRIDPVLERLPTSQKTDIGRAIYANSITLTPGTVSTDLRDGMVQVHALTSGAMERLRQGEMDARVTKLEGES